MQRLLPALAVVLALASSAPGHELWIDVADAPHADGLDLQLNWGHFDDQLEPVDTERHTLWARFPDERVERLNLLSQAASAGARVMLRGEGEYLFFAERDPGTYTPADGVTTLSVQSAKAVHQHGEGRGVADAAAGLAMEIVPTTDLRDFEAGTLRGRVLLDDGHGGGAAVQAYGPGGRHLRDTADDQGYLALSLDVPGIWLVLANVSRDEAGEVDGQAYERVSYTTTLWVDTRGESGADADAAAGEGVAGGEGVTGGWASVALAVGGMLGGAASALLALWLARIVARGRGGRRSDVVGG